MYGYCVKCRAKREMKNLQLITLRNGRTVTKGTCSICGTKMFRFARTSPEEREKNKIININWQPPPPYSSWGDYDTTKGYSETKGVITKIENLSWIWRLELWRTPYRNPYYALDPKETKEKVDYYSDDLLNNWSGHLHGQQERDKPANWHEYPRHLSFKFYYVEK